MQVSNLILGGAEREVDFVVARLSDAHAPTTPERKR
jgi:hypothetical protein